MRHRANLAATYDAYRDTVVCGRPFVKRFALCYQTVVCLSVLPVLSVTFVHCAKTFGRIKMKLGRLVGLGHGHIVSDGDPAPPPPKGHIPQSSAYICCGQMAAWIKMPLSMELGLGPGDFVRWEPRSCLPKGGRLRPPPNFFSAHVYCGQTAGWMKLVLGMEVGLSQATLC